MSPISISHALSSVKDKNIRGADKAMAKARKIVEHFSKSMQQTSKLLEFQSTSNLPMYSDPRYRPKKLLQDCITRWWSMYRMLKRLRLCKPALLCLRAAGTISCEMLQDNQWVILEQIEITLQKMATWQRILEGDKYPTGSLVVSAIFAIREHYVNVIACPDTQALVKSLAEILLDDFDKRYHPPADDVGKVRFTRDPETGERNRYTGVHPYFFVASFLDLRTKKALKRMMKTTEYKELRDYVLDLMVEDALEKEAKVVSKQTSGNSGNDLGENAPPLSGKRGKKTQADYAFDGLYDEDVEDVQDKITMVATIRVRCEHQLAAYDLLPQLPMKDKDGNYSNPLLHWKNAESTSPELSQLA